jgi:fructokinase
MIANCRYACIVNRGEELSVRIGIDLGGTKTEVIALSDQGEQLFRHRLPTPREDYRQTIETIATLVAMAEQATGQQGTVGMGIPGSISPYTGVVKNANSTWLNGQPFDKDLSQRLSGKCGWQTMPTAWRFRKRWTARRRGRKRCLR